MSDLAALVTHYSTMAFHTRIAALTFVGAVIGGTLKLLHDRDIAEVVAVGIILVVASLGELNRRYTHSYLSACSALSEDIPSDIVEFRAAAERWRIFRIQNERDWRSRSWRATINRFLLNWSTYVPGPLLAIYLAFLNGTTAHSYLIAIAAVMPLARWIYLAIRP